MLCLWLDAKVCPFSFFWGRNGIDRRVNGLVSMPEYDGLSPLTNSYQPIQMATHSSPWLPNSRN